jgi:hypothetical protein
MKNKYILNFKEFVLNEEATAVANPYASDIAKTLPNGYPLYKKGSKASIDFKAAFENAKKDTNVKTFTFNNLVYSNPAYKKQTSEIIGNTEIKTENDKKYTVKSDKINLSLFDYEIVDGDIVRVLVNNVQFGNDITLKREPQIIKDIPVPSVVSVIPIYAGGDEAFAKTDTTHRLLCTVSFQVVDENNKPLNEVGIIDVKSTISKFYCEKPLIENDKVSIGRLTFSKQ